MAPPRNGIVDDDQAGRRGSGRARGENSRGCRSWSASMTPDRRGRGARRPARSACRFALPTRTSTTACRPARARLARATAAQRGIDLQLTTRQPAGSAREPDSCCNRQRADLEDRARAQRLREDLQESPLRRRHVDLRQPGRRAVAQGAVERGVRGANSDCVMNVGRHRSTGIRLHARKLASPASLSTTPRRVFKWLADPAARWP